MAFSLADLKNNQNNNLNRLIQESEKLSKPSNSREADDRFWTPTLDKAGNGGAVIRFLPTPKVDGADGLPWVRYFSHGFKGPTGKWYIENSLTSIQQKDPVGEYNSALWNTGDEAKKDQARRQKRRETYVYNILVVNDPAVPENNGKVFLYRSGKKIYESKIRPIMFPDELSGEQPNDPFSFWTGQNFRLKVKTVSNFRNYDDSQFLSPSPISDDDDEIERIWNQEYSLLEFVDPKNYKSYDELKAHLDNVLGLTGTAASVPAKTAADVEAEEIDEVFSTTAKAVVEEKTKTVSSDDEDEDIDVDALLSGL